MYVDNGLYDRITKKKSLNKLRNVVYLCVLMRGR